MLGLAGIVALLVALLAGGVWATGQTMGWDGPGFMGTDRSSRQSMMDDDANGYGGMMGGRGGFGAGMMGGAGMMTGSPYGLAGDAPVTTMGQAGERARAYAETLGLRVGEVMEFTDNYYAEFLTPSGDKATEVLVDTDTGGVRIEFGPAMMWNTEYGMHAAGTPTEARVSPVQAERIANEWLADHREGLTAGQAEAFPGYYTLHTLDGDQIVGMLSVNGTTGAVWYHTWHGDFVAMSE